MGVPRWVRRFADEGRTGAYLSVVTPGTVRAGAAITVERPDHDVDLLLLFRGLMGDLGAARRVLDAGVAHAEVNEELAAILARRGG
jgi:MOSC domain-containing protein YiiM